MVERAYLIRKNKPSVRIPFLFNPKELSVEKGNQFAEVGVPGLSSPLLQFVKGNARTIILDLLFDTYERGEDVRTYTDQITGWDSGSMFSKLPGVRKGLMDIDPELHAPPVCIFVWGDFNFECVIEKCTKKFTMFLSDGKPVRATLNVTLKEYREADVQVKEIDAKSADITKRWLVQEGDSLWSIAAARLGSPADWRPIAEANGIDNPRLLKPGTELVIPRKE